MLSKALAVTNMFRVLIAGQKDVIVFEIARKSETTRQLHFCSVRSHVLRAAIAQKVSATQMWDLTRTGRTVFALSALS